MSSTYDSTQNVFKQIVERLEALSVGGGEGGSAGDTPETIAFYSAVVGDLTEIFEAITAGADTAAAASYYASATTALDAIKTAVEAAAPSGLTVTSQTLNALGAGATIPGAGKSSVGVQLLWTGASTDQVVRLEGTMDGGTSWINIGDVLPGDTIPLTEINASAAAGVQPTIRYPGFRSEHTGYRLRWVSGTATSLALTLGLS